MAYNSDYLVKGEHLGRTGNQCWAYHTADSPATVGAASYITDAAYSTGAAAKGGGRGMKKGDLVTSYHWSALPTDAMVDFYSPQGTAPTFLYTCDWVVDGIVAATGAAILSPAGVLTGSATYDAANLVDAAGATTTVTVTGAALGDFVTGVSFSVDLQGITVTAYVSAADTVSVRLQNESGGAIDLASATIRVEVKPRGF